MIDRSLSYGRHLVRRFLRDAAPYDRVLDIGAGHGNDLDAAREACPGAELHAVEVYPPYAEKLEAKGVRVHRLNLERDPIPLPDGSVDVVIANQVLEHTKEIFWIFHEVSRVLPVGGRFVIGVPNLASMHNRLLLLLGMQPTAIQNATAHVRGYTRRDLMSVAERVFPGGYRQVGYGGSNFYPFPGAVAKPLAAILPGLAWGLFLSLRKEREYAGEFLRYPVDQRLETNFFVG